MTTFKIPDSAEETVEQLGNVGRSMDRLTRLMTARKWERAALVACLVGPGLGHGPGRGLGKAVELQAFPYTIKDLAALGIHGLSSNKTIAGYRDAWCRDGRRPPDFGDEIDLDGLPEWTGAFPERPIKVTPAHQPEPEPEPEPFDTEAAAVRQAKLDGTLRIVRDESGQPTAEDVTVFTHNYDAAHLNIDRARTLLRDARRARDEDYPQLNQMQKFGVRAALAEIITLAEELEPIIEREDGSIVEKGEH